MSDYKDPLRSHWVEELEAPTRKTELPYHLAAWDYIHRKPPSRDAVTAEQMEPTNWLAEVERRKEIVEVEKANSERMRLAELERNRKVLPPASFNPKGVRISVFRKIVDSFGGFSALKGQSCSEVEEMMKQFCQSAKVKSYTHYLEEINSEFVGKADLYVSYASAGEYLSLVSTLEDHLQGSQAEEAFIWMDLFCKELLDTPNYDKVWYTITFPQGLATVGSYVLLHDYDESREEHCNPFKRTWICYELHTCFEQGIPFDIAMSPTEKNRFREEILSAPEQLMRFLPKIDIALTDSSSTSDYRGILAYMESRFYVQEVNSLIRDLLRTWLVRSIEEALKALSSPKDTSDIVANVLRNARRSRDYRHVDLALVLLEGCIAFADAKIKAGCQSNGVNVTDVFLAMYDESFSLRDDMPNAVVLSYFNSILAIKSRVYEDNEHGHVSIASTLTHIGRVMGRLGEEEQEQKAVHAYRSAIKMLSDLLGKEHTDVASAYHDLAVVFKAKGDRVNAEALASLGDPRKHQDLVRQQASELEQTREQRINNPLVCDYYHAVKYLTLSVQTREAIVQAQKKSVNAVEEERLRLADSYRLLAAVHDRLLDSYSAGKYYGQARSVRDAAYSSFEKDGSVVLVDYEAKEEEEQEELGGSAGEHVYQDKCYEAGAAAYAAGDMSASLTHFKRALRAAKRAFKADDGVHPVVATAYSNLSMVYNALNDVQAALRYGLRALDVRLACLGNDHPDVGASYNSLGLLLEAMAESPDQDLLWVDGTSMTPEEATQKAEEYYHQAGETRLRSRSRSRSRSRGFNGDVEQRGEAESRSRGREGRDSDDEGFAYYRDRASSPQRADRVEKRTLTRYIEEKDHKK